MIPYAYIHRCCVIPSFFMHTRSLRPSVCPSVSAHTQFYHCHSVHPPFWLMGSLCTLIHINQYNRMNNLHCAVTIYRPKLIHIHHFHPCCPPVALPGRAGHTDEVHIQGDGNPGRATGRSVLLGWHEKVTRKLHNIVHLLGCPPC